VRDPLEGWARKDGALAGPLGLQYAPVDGAGAGLQFGEVGKPATNGASRSARSSWQGCLPIRSQA
jgi:hypothetical protein